MDMDLWTAPPDALIRAFRQAGVRRAYLVTHPETGVVQASHPMMEPVARRVAEDTRDYRAHEGVFFELGAESGHLLTAAIHKTRRGQAAGGVRYWTYPTVEALVRDGLRLSRGMGLKCALAGLWWGGGKGVIARGAHANHQDPATRAAVYRDYGRFMTGLRGAYVTAEDVGTTTEDMAWLYTTTRHTTCIPLELGGSGNPSVLTATGVVVAMEAALHHLGMGELEGKTVAMQGLGNVSRFMVRDLLERGVARIVGTDIDARAVEAMSELYPGAPLTLRVVAPHDASILAEPCDILAPNAVGATLNPGSIQEIRARLVCGAANNQLEDSDRDADLLARRGILYVPDFLANRMGIVNCANEQYGVMSEDPAIRSHLSRRAPAGVYQRTLEVLRRAQQTQRTSAREAEELAEELSEELHPIWGHRGQQIISSLVRDGWAEG